MADANPQGILFAGADEWVRDLAKTIKNAGFNVTLVDTNYSHISEAKMLGLPAYCASILSDYVREELDLAGIGNFVALTRNDEVNELGVNEFSHVFGRKNVYRLPLNDKSKGRRAALGGKTRGRLLFDGNWGEKRIFQAYQNGWRVKSTKLTEEFGFEQFKENYGEDYLIVAAIENKKLMIATVDNPLVPATGQTLISFVKAPASRAAST
ncbi:MAG: NAD-binding protein [Pirellulaceae bacterium]